MIREIISASHRPLYNSQSAPGVIVHVVQHPVCPLCLFHRHPTLKRVPAMSDYVTAELCYTSGTPCSIDSNTCTGDRRENTCGETCLDNGGTRCGSSYCGYTCLGDST
ncbi:hypothetical protein ANO14919_078660 [Xylariales sp. No.14919]|nr:hypothetical protein ANO14919_078660 [Xylariales sp. No.14919]